MTKIYDQASDVQCGEYEVIIRGPDSVSVSLTPQAAVETANRLLRKAAEAEGDGLVSDDARKTHHGAEGAPATDTPSR